MTDEQLDAKVAPTLEFCSPYRAVRFLAFKERPIEERYAMLAYKAQNNYNSLCPWANSDSELTWESSELQSKYYEACNLLKLQLMLGAIQSRGCPVPDTARIKNFWEKCVSLRVARSVYAMNTAGASVGPTKFEY